MDQDFFELSLVTSCELLPFFCLMPCVCVPQCCTFLFVQAYCMKSPVAIVSKWMQHWSERIVYILILLDLFYIHFSLLLLHIPPQRNFNSSRLAIMCSQPAVCCIATDLSVPDSDYVQCWTIILDLVLCLGDFLNILNTGSLSIIRYIGTTLLGS